MIRRDRCADRVNAACVFLEKDLSREIGGCVHGDGADRMPCSGAGRNEMQRLTGHRSLDAYERIGMLNRLNEGNAHDRSGIRMRRCNRELR